MLSFASELQHIWDVLFILPTLPEAVGPFRMGLDLLFQPDLVTLFVLFPHLPLAGVIAKFGLIHHGDAIFDRADCLTDPTPAAGLHVGVVQAVRSDVEARVWTLQPAKGALDTGIEVHHGPHGAGGELLESRIAIGPEAAHGMRCRVFKAVSRGNAGDGNTLSHLMPLRKVETIRLFGIAWVRLACDARTPLIRFRGRRGFELIVPLVHDGLLDRLETEQFGQDPGNGT